MYNINNEDLHCLIFSSPLLRNLSWVRIPLSALCSKTPSISTTNRHGILCATSLFLQLWNHEFVCCVFLNKWANSLGLFLFLFLSYLGAYTSVSKVNGFELDDRGLMPCMNTATQFRTSLTPTHSLLIGDVWVLSVTLSWCWAIWALLPPPFVALKLSTGADTARITPNLCINHGDNQII
jgi:hypothetical protein